MQICKVYRGDDDSNCLLLVSGDWVINGEWHLDYARDNGIKITMVGYIDHHGDYNATLYRFRQGERMVPDKCPCCETIKSWKKVNE